MRIVLHLDMDAFFAAIEQRDDPRLMGQPVIIGYPGLRGVVATCSYEARHFGVCSAMPSVVARRCCPNAVWIHGHMSRYRDCSRRIFNLLREALPVVEQVSVDEAYAELTGFSPSLGRARDLAEELKEMIYHEEGLTASIGLASCRFLAKIASDLDKPDGLVVIRPKELRPRIHPLSVRKIPGVGPKMAARLQRLGVTTIGQLAAVDEALLRRHFGVSASTFLAARARGEDETPINLVQPQRSISEERTYLEDLVDDERICRELLARAEGVARALRDKELCARCVVLKARDERFHTVTRHHTFDVPTDLSEEIFAAVRELWRKKVDFGGRGVRLLGVGASQLVPRRELPGTLFPDAERERSRKVARATDELRRRFGNAAIRPGRLIDPPGAGGSLLPRREADEEPAGDDSPR